MNFGSGFAAAKAEVGHAPSASAPAADEMKSRLLSDMEINPFVFLNGRNYTTFRSAGHKETCAQNKAGANLRPPV